MENHSVPTRTEVFPVGLRVLVVDDDPTWLKILEKMLRKCSYEVTTCGLARVALDILRERKNKFDIVISDVNMPDMDGFKLLEHIGLEMDLPVIMMSIDGETSRVMKGVQHGACDYLLKPVRMKELRNIWQHVYRKKMHEVKEIEGHEFSCDDLQLIQEAGFEGFEERGLLTREDKKRKEEYSDDGSDQSAVKKARVVWSVDLHQKFVNAVNQIGIDKVGPKKILDLMNVPGLTRENVASHLQKYRLYLSRLQKQNEDSASGNNRRPDFNPKEQPTKPDQKASHQVQQSTNSNPGPAFGFVAPKPETQPAKPASHFDEDNKAKRKTSSMPPLGMLLSFTSTVPSAEMKTSESLTTSKHPTGGLPLVQFMQYPKHDRERCDFLDDYSCLPKPNLFTSAPPVISINMHNETGDLFDMKPALLDCFKAISPLTYTVDGSALGLDRLTGTKGCFQQNCSRAEPSVIMGSDLAPLPEDLNLYSSLHEIGCFENVGLMNSIDLFQTEIESSNNWCDGSELLEYPLIDECLFA